MNRIGLQRRQAWMRFAALGSANWPKWVADTLPQALALVASATAYGLGAGTNDQSDPWVWAILAVAFVSLRIATANTDLVPSTYALDAIGVAVFIGGTGGAASPFLAIALSGAWWAAQKAGRGRLYGLVFCAAYVILVAPQAARDGDMAAVIYQPTFVLAIGYLRDRLRSGAEAANGQAEDMSVPATEIDVGSVKAGLTRAVGGGLIPIDVLLTAGQLGLTAVQAELIPYLMLGLSNQEIADALSVSEATVRYRLTRLYRALGVRGRKAAAERAHELGLAALLPATAPNHA